MHYSLLTDYLSRDNNSWLSFPGLPCASLFSGACWGVLFCQLQLGREDTPTFVQNWNFSTCIQLCSNVIVFFSLFVQKTNCLWVPCLKVKSDTKGKKLSLLHLARPEKDESLVTSSMDDINMAISLDYISAIDDSKILALPSKTIVIKQYDEIVEKG